MLALRRRVVAGPAETRVQPQPGGLGGDVGLGHAEQRGVDREAVALDPGTGGEVRHPLERLDEIRAAVGITRIIERVDADRSEERRVGNACVSTCRSRWSPSNSKKNQQQTTT